MSLRPAFRPCAIVPVYNHGSTALAVVRGLAERSLPAILVDDGSGSETKAALRLVLEAVPGTRLLTLPENRGKGGAVIRGFALAKEAGYTHALQVDADGQHDLGEIPRFLAAAAAEPEAVVAGAPVYDASAPRSRMAGRKITNFWVAVETLSRDIPDAMIGFRVYPVELALRVASRAHISERMGFDIDIIVRIHWSGASVRFLPVRVAYPEGGTSNFRMLEDNVLISLLHARLFFGMLLRSPLLVARRLARARRAAGQGEGHWADQREKGGGYWQLRLMLALRRFLGRGPLTAIMRPVVFFFYLFSRSARASSRAFLSRAAEAAGRPAPRGRDSLLHFMSFAEALVDKIDAWSSEIGVDDLRFRDDGVGPLVSDLRSGKGALLLCSHLGNTELLRALANLEVGERLDGLSFTSIIEIASTARFNRLIAEVDPRAAGMLVAASDMGPDTMIMLKGRVDAGGLVAIAGDRVAAGNRGRVVEVEFLGREACLPLGPFVLADLLEAPVYFVSALRESDLNWKAHYEFRVTRATSPIGGEGGGRGARAARVAALAAEYASDLGRLAAEHPYQWYNFFDFWNRGK
jgi:predicted LPLAT superfamily acyltransferase